jgi:hypothetical protein
LDAVTHRTSITSPGFPKDYCDKLTCIYDVQGTNAYAVGGAGTTHSALKATFEHFDLEHNVDYLTLHDMYDSTARLLVG